MNKQVKQTKYLFYVLALVKQSQIFQIFSLIEISDYSLGWIPTVYVHQYPKKMWITVHSTSD